MNSIIKKLENESSKLQCTNCKRVTDLNENDEYVCKYHNTSIFSKRPKCKYFKRDRRYITTEGLSKIKEIWFGKNIVKVTYKHGKFVFK